MVVIKGHVLYGYGSVGFFASERGLLFGYLWSLP